MRDIIPPAKKLIEDHNTQSGRDHHIDTEQSGEQPIVSDMHNADTNEVFYELPDYSRNQVDKVTEVSGEDVIIEAPIQNINMLGHKEEKAFQSLYQKPIRQTPLEQPKKSKMIPAIIGVIILVILSGLGLMTFVFDRASVTLNPKLSELQVNSSIVFSPDELAEATTIKRITLSDSASKAILRRGEKTVETKAEGTIVIYNNYSTAPQKLVKNTRFEGTNGKVYRINESITIPGMSGNTPGSLEVLVYADSTGSEYNSSPMDFTIPGFKGTPRYTGFYARSKGSISGGYSGKMSVVAPEDLQNVETELTESLKGKLLTQVRSSVPDGYLLIEDGIAYTSTDNRTVLATDSSADFSVQISVAAYILDIKALGKEILVKNGITDQSRKIDNLESLNIKPTASSVAGGYSLSVSGNTQVGSEIDELAIKQRLAGVSAASFEDAIAEFSGVDTAELSIRPYWGTRIPTDISKINIEVRK